MCSGHVIRYYAIFSAIVGATAAIGFADFHNYFAVALCCLYAVFSLFFTIDLYKLHSLVPVNVTEKTEGCLKCDPYTLSINYVETNRQRRRLLLLPFLGVLGSIATFIYEMYIAISQQQELTGSSDWMGVIWSWMWFKISFGWFRFGRGFHLVGTAPLTEGSSRLIAPEEAPGPEFDSSAVDV